MHPTPPPFMSSLLTTARVQSSSWAELQVTESNRDSQTAVDAAQEIGTAMVTTGVHTKVSWFKPAALPGQPNCAKIMPRPPPPLCFNQQGRLHQAAVAP